jgi:hypothetical protein
VVAYEVEARAEREKRESSLPFESLLYRETPKTAPDPPTGSRAAAGCRNQAHKKLSFYSKVTKGYDYIVRSWRITKDVT